MGSILFNNLLFFLSSFLFFHLATFNKSLKWKEIIGCILFIMAVVMPITVSYEYKFVINYANDSSLLSTIVAPIEEITKLFPLLILFIGREKRRKRNILDFVFIGALSGTCFAVFENILYGRVAELSTFVFGNSTKSYLDYSVTFSHIVSTALISLLIGFVFIKGISILKRILFSLIALISLVYLMFEHGFYNYALESSLFGIIEYDMNNIYSKIHDMLGQNKFTLYLFLILIVVAIIYEFKRKYKLKELLSNYKNDLVTKNEIKKNIIFFSVSFLAFILVIILSYFLKDTSVFTNSVFLLEALDNLLEILKIVLMIAIIVAAWGVNPLFGLGLLSFLINPILGAFNNTWFAEKLKGAIGEDTYNSIIGEIAFWGILLGLGGAVATLFSGGLLAVALGMLSYSMAAKDLIAMNKVMNSSVNWANEYVKSLEMYKGISPEFIFAIAVSIMAYTGVNATGVAPIDEVFSNSTLLNGPFLESISYAPFDEEKFREALYTHSVTDSSNFEYDTIYDEWTENEITEDRKEISEIKDKLENGIEINFDGVFSEGYLSNLHQDEKIVLAASIYNSGNYEEYKYGKNKIIYNEETGISVIVNSNNELMDVQALPKEFIYFISSEKEAMSDELVDANISALEEGYYKEENILALLMMKESEDIDEENLSKIDSALQSLPKEEYEDGLNGLKDRIEGSLIDILSVYDKENYDYSDSYRVNKASSIAISKEAVATRDYIKFCYESINWINDFMEIEEEKDESLEGLIKEYKFRSNFFVKKFDFTLPYRLVSKY